MHQDLIAIDGLQYSNWSRQIFEQFRRGGLSAVHVTIAYWENARETLSNIGRWNQHYEQHGDLIMPVHTVADIHEAKRLNKTGIIYGFQNCSPIEDDIALIEVFQQLGGRGS
jgi:microsomal dipeptidase-like Zn-dependent dipeptidase